MKLITRCPQCHTSFRVHDHQLAVRQGRVRCGACGHVFDAYSTLTEQPDEDRAAYPVEWQLAQGTTAAASAQRSAHVGEYQDPVSLVDPIFDIGNARAPQHSPAAEPVARATSEIAHEFRADRGTHEFRADPGPGAHPAFRAEDLALPPSSGFAAPAASSADSDASAAPAAEVPAYSIADPLPIVPAPSEPQIAPVPEPDAVEGDFSFGPRRASLRARIGMSIAAGLLAVIALGQLAYATRSYIAAWAPGTRPVFEQICSQLGCDVPQLRRTEAVLLDSSELEREEAGLLTLSAVIRNTSVFEQALPSLMLTLMDDRNRAISRRVLEPKDYLADPATNAQVLPASGAVQATVYIDTAKLGQAAANYELIVFYR